MSEEKKLALLKQAIERFGTRSQIDKAVEEMAELIKALMKCRYADAPKDIEIDVVEEIADVSIMIDQLIMIFACDDKVKLFKANKLNKLNVRMNSGLIR